MRQAIQDESSISPQSTDKTLGPFLAVGELQLRPHLFASLVHADGLPVQSGLRVTSDIYTFAPGLLADLGTHWTFDYTATAHNYSATELRNTVDHDVRLVGANRSPDWGLQLTESYSVTSAILVETAQQTKQKTWVNSVSADHNFGNLLRYQGTFGMNDLKTQAFSETRDWQTEQWVRATVSPKTDAGFGLGFGYSDIVAKPNSYYEKYLGELKWRATDRINLALQGGWEDWHSVSAAIGSERSPILQASLGYQPIDQTRIAITGFRTVANTLTGDAVTTSDGWSVSLNQRLLGKLFLQLAYNENNSDYHAANGNLLLGRSDRVKSFNTALSILFFNYWTVAATYQSSKNDSNLAGFQYSSTQYGLEVRARF